MEPIESTMARADRLRRAREGRSFESATAAADHFGWKRATYLSHENGNRGIPRAKLLEYARAFRVPALYLLTGTSGPDVITVLESAPVVGEIAAGVWREDGLWLDGKYPVAPKVLGRYAGLSQAAYIVSDKSADGLRVLEGDVAITVAYGDVRQAALEGDVVVVERRNGELTERTIKRIKIVDGETILIGISSDNRLCSEVSSSSGGAEIIALVIGAYRPIS